MRHLKQTLAFAAAMALCACNVEPDMSNRFTFTGQTVTDFLLSNDSIFSSFNYILRRSGQDRILSSYGNYTCFAPKNGAVEAYIDSLWNDRESVDEDGNLLHNGLTDNSLEGLTDSLCTDIAMYHLMKTELTTTQMLTAGGATYRTMLGRFITAGGRGSQILVNEGAPIDRQMCDNKVENGIVHAIGRCIPRSNRMVVQELKADSAHFAIFYEALCATGIDALLAEDDKQLAAPAPDPVAGYYTPTVCKRGFTLFAEPDAVFHANGIHSLADLAERCREWYGKCATGQRSMDEGWYDWFRNNNIAVDTGDDYTKENNVLHMFVAYHVLRAAVHPDILAFKKNTYVGNGWLGEAYDYYETMLPKTLVKAWMVYDKATGRYNTLLNRYVRNNTLTDGVETLGSDAMHEVVAEGIGMDLDAVKRPLNGYIYPLDGILLYDGKVPLGVLNERLRFDALTLCRETMDNGFRGATISEITALNAGKSAPRIRYPIDYFDNVKVFNGNNTKFDQTVVPDPDGKAWALYKADSFQGMGVFDFAIKLPPVPDGTYELRVDLDCMEHGSMVQYYLGDTPDINAFEPLGVPMDMRIPQNDFTDPRVVAMGCVPLDDPENYPEAYADRGVFMVRAADPAGPWSDPLMVIEGKGYIDTTPLWDDDGRCYLVNGWANSRIGFNGVLTVRELSADGTRPIGDPCIVFDGDATRNVTTEGPKFYKRDGWYWILCPAGSVAGGLAAGHAQPLALRPLRVAASAAAGHHGRQRPAPGRVGAHGLRRRLVCALPRQGPLRARLPPAARRLEQRLARDGARERACAHPPQAQVGQQGGGKPRRVRRVRLAPARPAVAVAGRLRRLFRPDHGHGVLPPVHLQPAAARQRGQPVARAQHAFAEDTGRRVHRHGAHIRLLLAQQRPVHGPDLHVGAILVGGPHAHRQRLRAAGAPQPQGPQPACRRQRDGGGHARPHGQGHPAQGPSGRDAHRRRLPAHDG